MPGNAEKTLKGISLFGVANKVRAHTMKRLHNKHQNNSFLRPMISS